MSQPKRVSRREFVAGGLAATAAFTIVPRHVLGGPRYTPPSETITRAVIGTGGMGRGHIVSNQPGQTPVTLAVCDVDEHHLKLGLDKAGEKCDGYTDWRRVLERKDIDTVHIATPPHWHALQVIAAAEAGFDILGEKPMAHTIAESRAMVTALQRHGRMYHVNTFGRLGNYQNYGSTRMLKKLVDSGLLGRPLTVRLGRSTGFNWKVAEWSGRTYLEQQPIPSQLDYDMWLGPAPRKPYHPHRVHGSFRGYWDYDGGGLTDMGQHYLDPVQYFLGKDDTSPSEIEAIAPWPQHTDAVGMWGTVTLKYADGDTIILNSGEWGAALPDGLPLIEGPHGKVFPNYRTEPAGLFDRLAGWPDPPAPRGFEEAVRTRKKSSLSEASSHRSCTLVNLAAIAIRLGRPLRFDPVRERFIGDDFANRLVDPPMRAPWRL